MKRTNSSFYFIVDEIIDLSFFILRLVQSTKLALMANKLITELMSEKAHCFSGVECQ